MLDDRIVKRIGEYLHAYRRARRMSLRELSDRCGVSRSTISRYEAGMDGDIDKYHMICNALGVNFNDVVRQAQKSVAEEYLVEVEDLKSDLMLTQAELAVKEKELVGLFRQLNGKSQEAVLSFLEAMPKENQYDRKT